MSTPQFEQPVPAGSEGAGVFSTPDHTASSARADSSGSSGPGTGATAKAVKGAIGKLGDNKKVRGGPRKLKPEDRQKIADLYKIVGAMTRGFKPEIDAIINSPVIDGEMIDGEFKPVMVGTTADVCAQAWFELAEENDTVRRMILACIETGAWGKLITVNMPILLVALPDDFMTRALSLFMPIRRAQHAQPNSSDNDQYPQGETREWGPMSA